jgi:hypothetical protein
MGQADFEKFERVASPSLRRRVSPLKGVRHRRPAGGAYLNQLIEDMVFRFEFMREFTVQNAHPLREHEEGCRFMPADKSGGRTSRQCRSASTVTP